MREEVKMIRIIFLMAFMLVLSIDNALAQEIPAAETGKLDRTGSYLSDPKAGWGVAGLVNAGTYAFTAQSGIALEDMSSGSNPLLGSNLDNDSSAPAPIGFLFRFDGVNFTDFGVNVNGLVRLGGQVTTTSTLNALNSVTNAPKITPFWDDLCIGTGGKVHYRTTGVFGSRKLVVEWQNMKVTRGGACDGTGGGTFQMWLFEGTGVIHFVYGGGIAGSANGGYSVGIQSGSATNFASVTTATNTVSYSTANNTQMDAIAAGTSYLFSPVVPAAPSGGSVAPVRQASLQLNWTDNASGEDGYVVWRSMDNINFSLVGQLPADATSFADSGLTPSTQYFYRVSAMGIGAFSPVLTFSPTTNTPGSISSTAAGGLWSSPSTWAGGVVPDGGDTVTIPSGATVIIDTAAVAGSVAIGNVGSLAEGKDVVTEGGSPAVLVFGEDAVFSLTVAGDVTIGSNDTLTTGGGTITDHVLSVGGNLTNNGTLDLSTNNNLAGAGIVFTGSSSKSFNGAGAVTDVRTITVNKGPTNANILELSPSNFTVRGSASQNTGSAYLTLNQGTFKISGTFFGSHTTFSVAAYNIGASAGLWLNNPNYTIVALNDMSFVTGLMRISAGTWNVGGTDGQPMTLFAGSTTIIEGGNLNLAAGLSGGGTFTQTGGTVTSCRLALTSSASNRCISLAGAVTMTGGEIVLQNPSAHNLGGGPEDYAVNVGSGPAAMNPITGTIVRFGNALTAGTRTFRAGGLLPDVVIDNSAGGHKLILGAPQEGTSTRDVNISAGTTLEFARFNMMGTSFVNNGILNVFAPGYLAIDDGTGTSDITYSGTGVMTGQLVYFVIRGHSMTFDPSAGNIRSDNLSVDTAQVINAARITFGTGNNQLSAVGMVNGASLDSAPDFNIGTGGQKVYYGGTGNFTTGPEIKPDRILREFEANVTGSVTINGGDLVITGTLHLTNGEVVTGESSITVSQFSRGTGYVNGAFRWRIPSTGFLTFPIGQNGTYLPISASINAIGVVPSFLSIRPIDVVLPGLLPSTSASRYWRVEETGDVAMSIAFRYSDADVNGNEANYKLFRSSGGAPVLIAGSSADPGNNVVGTPFGVTQLTGDWGIGEQLDPGPVSISGRVTTAGGMPIRNATVTISGGGLTAPITVITGSLGTYVFNGLQAGETYTVTASAKRFRFPLGGRQVTPMTNVADVDIAANPQEEF